MRRFLAPEVVQTSNMDCGPASLKCLLEELYKKMKDKPVTVDLDNLWRQLGVAHKDGTATFDDRAPLAPIREAISTGKAGKALTAQSPVDRLMTSFTARQ